MNRLSFGRRLRELRAAAGLTQRELAGRTGIPAVNISQWECGLYAPLVLDVPRLAQALGVDANALFADPSPEAPPIRRGRPARRTVPPANGDFTV